MDRRSFMKWISGAAGVLAAGKFIGMEAAMAAHRIEKISKSNTQWQKELTPQQYDVLREEDTERAFTSPLNNEKRSGMYACAGCGMELFPSKYKFDSGTGWPSFFDALPGHIETKTDYLLVMPRTEYHCARCGGHHGHVFDDGPAPTGLRYCNNGVALKFIADGGKS